MNESLIEDIDSYIYSNQYNMNTADLVLCALHNALMVTAVIYEVRESSVVTLSHELGRDLTLVLIINYGVKCSVLFCCILVNMVRKYKRRTERGKFTAADLHSFSC